MPIKPKYTPDFCNYLVDAMAKGDSLVEVCADNNIAYSTLYNWLSDSDPQYDQLRDAVEIGNTKYEAAMLKLGKRGIKGQIDNFKGDIWKSIMANHFGYADKKDIKKEVPKEQALSDSELDTKLKELGYTKAE